MFARFTDVARVSLTDRCFRSGIQRRKPFEAASQPQFELLHARRGFLRPRRGLCHAHRGGAERSRVLVSRFKRKDRAVKLNGQIALLTPVQAWVQASVIKRVNSAAYADPTEGSCPSRVTRVVSCFKRRILGRHAPTQAATQRQFRGLIALIAVMSLSITGIVSCFKRRILARRWAMHDGWGSVRGG
jgi:hypothetical protein